MGAENDSTASEGTPYKVCNSEELGRFMVAVHDLNPGDLVLSEKPLVFGPKATADPEAIMPCVGCYKAIPTDIGERCASCGWPVCSGNCPGLKDPRHHGAECEVLSMRPDCVVNNMADYYRHDALLPLRCIMLQKSDPEKWKLLMAMQSHMDCRTPGTEAFDEANEFIVQYLSVNFLKPYMEYLKNENIKQIPNMTTDIVHKMCGIIDTNALEIRLEGVDMLSLYTNTCIMEHSCIPNTRHNFERYSKDKNNIFKITVSVGVPLVKDSHISTMYSHALWGTQARRQHLKETKYFSCRCVRCSDPTELGTYLSAMKCLGDGVYCDGIHLPEDPLDEETDWACNKCPVKVPNSQVFMLISQMEEEVENVQMMNPTVPMLENILARLSKFLHPNHYHMYSIKHSLIQLYGRQPNYMTKEILDKKIKMCKELITITKTLDPGNTRLSLYTSVLQHELHSALIIKAKQTNSNDSNEIKSLLKEAKRAIEIALNSLSNEMDESAGKKLYPVIKKSEDEFERFCKEIYLS